jgi:hypothetical protein
MIKRYLVLLVCCGLSGIAQAQDASPVTDDHSMHHHMNMGMNMGKSPIPGANGDKRVNLHLEPEMRAHQLSVMRSHLQAIQAIIRLMGANDYAGAAQVAQDRLGLSPQMKRMCMMFTQDYSTIGLAFHHSAENLAATLKEGHAPQALQALGTTMHYCVQCHETFHY